MDPYAIIVKPHVTEKTMNLIDQNNELTFVVNVLLNNYMTLKLKKLTLILAQKVLNLHILS